MPRVRVAVAADVPKLAALQRSCYPFLATRTLWAPRHLRSHQRNFPEGQLVVEVAGRVVAHCATFRTTPQRALKPHTFLGITHRGTFNGHVPGGDVLYGAEIMVHPDQRRRGIAKLLYQARFDLMRRLGIRRFVAGGRLPGYHRFASIMDPEEYVRAVRRGKLADRVLTPQLRSGLEAVGVLPGYLDDPKSMDCASLLVLDLEKPRRTMP